MLVTPVNGHEDRGERGRVLIVVDLLLFPPLPSFPHRCTHRIRDTFLLRACKQGINAVGY